MAAGQHGAMPPSGLQETRFATLISGPIAGPAGVRSATVMVQTDRPAFVQAEIDPASWAANSVADTAANAATNQATNWAANRVANAAASPVALGAARSRAVAPADELALTPVASVPRRVGVHTQAQQENVGRLEFTGLAGGARLQYRLRVDGKLVEGGKLFEVRTQPDSPWNQPYPNYRIALGSCSYLDDPPFDRPGPSFSGGTGMFDVMAARAPDLTLWLGDNLYLREADFASRAGMAARWKQDFTHPAKRNLLRTGQHAAVWDDHDYGPNDSNSSYEMKDESLRLFSSYWPNPSFGIPGMPGVFTKFGFADADVFLLDGRWYRDSHLGPAVVDGRARRVFGEAQMAWLRNALLASNKPLKIIASGGQFLADGYGWEGWHHYPVERDGFLAWLREAAISGVVFASGDRHHTELIKIDRAGTYPLYELSCSPLTAAAFDAPQEQGMPRVVPGTWVAQRNFCEMRVEGPGNARVLTLESFNLAGQPLWTHSVPLGALRAPSPLINRAH